MLLQKDWQMNVFKTSVIVTVAFMLMTGVSIAGQTGFVFLLQPWFYG